MATDQSNLAARVRDVAIDAALIAGATASMALLVLLFAAAIQQWVIW